MDEHNSDNIEYCLKGMVTEAFNIDLSIKKEVEKNLKAFKTVSGIKKTDSEAVRRLKTYILLRQSCTSQENIDIGNFKDNEFILYLAQILNEPKNDITEEKVFAILQNNFAKDCDKALNLLTSKLTDQKSIICLGACACENLWNNLNLQQLDKKINTLYYDSNYGLNDISRVLNRHPLNNLMFKMNVVANITPNMVNITTQELFAQYFTKLGKYVANPFKRIELFQSLACHPIIEKAEGLKKALDYYEKYPEKLKTLVEKPNATASKESRIIHATSILK